MEGEGNSFLSFEGRNIKEFVDIFADIFWTMICSMSHGWLVIESGSVFLFWLCHQYTVWPWAGHSTSLSLSFLIWQVRKLHLAHLVLKSFRIYTEDTEGHVNPSGGLVIFVFYWASYLLQSNSQTWKTKMSFSSQRNLPPTATSNLIREDVFQLVTLLNKRDHVRARGTGVFSQGSLGIITTALWLNEVKLQVMEITGQDKGWSRTRQPSLWSTWREGRPYYC